MMAYRNKEKVKEQQTAAQRDCTVTMHGGFQNPNRIKPWGLEAKFIVDLLWTGGWARDVQGPLQPEWFCDSCLY